MSEPITFDAAQADMRSAYLNGAPGALASGLVWLTAAGVAITGQHQLSVYVLLIGGMLIVPLGVLFLKLLGEPGKHSPWNPLAQSAGEGTAWFLVGIAVVFILQASRLDLFFPAMLLMIGGRYLTFQTLYGLKIYWVFGALLCVAGLALGMTQAPVPAGAIAGAATEIVFASLLFRDARRGR